MTTKTTRQGRAKKPTASDLEEIARNVRMVHETMHHAVELWNVRSASVIRKLIDVAEELRDECSKPDSYLKFLELTRLTEFVADLEAALSALCYLLPPCDYMMPNPASVLRSCPYGPYAAKVSA